MARLEGLEPRHLGANPDALFLNFFKNQYVVRRQIHQRPAKAAYYNLGCS